MTTSAAKLMTVDEFLGWAANVAGRGTRLLNDVELLRWNTDKVYLRDLERAGLPVVPTVWDPASAGDLPDAGEWVVKPSVSAGSRDTARWTDQMNLIDCGFLDAPVAELAAAPQTLHCKLIGE